VKQPVLVSARIQGGECRPRRGLSVHGVDAKPRLVSRARKLRRGLGWQRRQRKDHA
jgi:hypothetical protein